MKDLAIAALVPKQAGWENERLVVGMCLQTEELDKLRLWFDLVTELAVDGNGFKGATFEHWDMGPWLLEVPEGTYGYPMSATWGKVDPALVPRFGSPLGHKSFPHVSWVITPAFAQAVLEIPGRSTLRAPVLTNSMLHELTSSPLELLADVGLAGSIKGFPTSPGHYIVEANVQGVVYKQTVEVVPSDALEGRLEVILPESSQRVELERMVPNSRWFAL